MIQEHTKSKARRWTGSSRLLQVVVGGTAIVALMAGCTSQGKSDATGAAGTSSGGGSATQSAGDAAALVAKYYKGTVTAPPADGPAAVTGKKVWIISCGQAAPSCSEPVAAMKTAAQAIGWNVTVFDGQLNPAKYSQGISQAIAAGADGILVNSIDCAAAPGPFEQAKKAGIVIAGLYAFDCDKDPVFSTWPKWSGYDDLAQVYQAWGAARAAWIIDQTKGKANVIDTTVPSYRGLVEAEKGFKAEMATCSGCKVATTVSLPVGDIVAGTAGAKVTNALQQHPDANSFLSYNDAGFTQFENASFHAAGATKLLTMGGECLPGNVDEIRSGGPEDACAVLPQDWHGWAVVDEVNRQFAKPGSAPVDEGLGMQIIDKDHNLPASGGWVPPVDFKAAYMKVWGVS
ncbi:monosaccharide ABC transporter substrate-binding protein (CUT2 family) [Jatrophihabitans sp. GAS493]|uniref:sugar ABC transporter substrate-binding protein n=1 Tax=Jatrophihabitans sp. GAS493 TaxID=1907575 RepID=UPI000BB8C9F4|nr:substrate-binding domain-containing protein [Jatrophihabitans sp. GAS493]SOD71823.1 monosaccharide ABC transporter substrate-binding protein (CUT2 family) [Jatrophihabitans sp. GAS493]